VRLTGGEPLVRRDFPRWRRCSPPLVEDLSVTTNGYLLERDAEALVRAGVTRFNVSIDSLQRDRFFEMTRRDALPRCCAASRSLAGFPEAHPIKVNAVAMRGFTEDEVLPFARFAREHPYEVRFIEFMPLDADHAGRPTASCPATRSARSSTPAYRSSPSRASRTPPRACTASPTAGLDRLHQPGQRAVLRRLQPHPPDRRRRLRTCLFSLNETDLRAPLRAGATTTSSRRSCAPRCGARSSSTASTSRASSSRRDDERDRRLSAAARRRQRPLEQRRRLQDVLGPFDR
jgi:cyclic pyranopterin phosphate synthase